MGKKMAGTNEFAFFFAVEAYVPGGGVQNQAEKNSKKCLLAGTGTKIYFSRWINTAIVNEYVVVILIRPGPLPTLRIFSGYF